MATENLVNVKDDSALKNALVAQLTGQTSLTEDDLTDILDWGSADISGLDKETRGIITSTLATIVSKQEVVGAYVPEGEVNIIKSAGEYEDHAGIVQRLRLGIPSAESDSDVYDPDTTGNTAQALFGKKGINISTTYYFKPFAHRYAWSEGSRWFTGLLLKGRTIREIYAMMRTMVVNAQRLEVEAQTLAAIRASMMVDINSGSVVNLLEGYNNEYGTSLTAVNAIQTPEFLQYCGRVFETEERKLKKATTLYNPMDFLTGAATTVGYFNAEFVSAYKRNFLIDAFNANLGGLVENKSITWWKAPSNNGDTSFATTSTINDKITVSWVEDEIVVNKPYVVGTIMDAERIGLFNFGVENTEQQDPSALSTNYFSHVYGSMMCDPYYNAVTFIIADPDVAVVNSKAKVK